ncbi:MAG: hypothetical protein EPN23_02740 [Verrucomicrobia bacterium]|nr:MAG: hypothetical protein EPN23_02740 [Verrucomicrobiota bacterium]
MKKPNGRAESRRGGIPPQRAKTVGLAVRPYLTIKQSAILVWSLTIIAGAFFAALAAILTCPKCSYEYPEDATTCAHCGTALPKPPPNPALTATASINTTWTTAADDDWRKANEANTQNKAWLAWLYARNAYALNMMTEGTNSARAIKLTDLMENLEKRLRVTTTTCPLCQGSGHSDIHIKMSDGREQVLHSSSKLCARCEGAGALSAIVRADVLNHMCAQTKRDYDALQKDRGGVTLEGLWLRPELADSLAPKDRAQLLRALGSPCLDCAGMGILACTKCDGAGWIKCSNVECISGTMPCADCGGTGKPNKKAATASASKTSTTKYVSLGSFCQTCNGTGRTTCRTCKGQASLPCTTCNGKSSLVCKYCNGTGQNPLCTTCKGDGLITCPHCRGSGKYQTITCPDCKGVGQIVCTNCKGVGRRPKH